MQTELINMTQRKSGKNPEGKGLRSSLLMFCLCLFFTSFSAFAQGSFTATVDKKRVSVNGTIQLTFTLTNADGRNFTPPSLRDFTVLSGPSQSSNVQINGG